LAYADGVFALSRNIGDSFAILAPDKTVGIQKVSFSSDSGIKVVTKGLPRVLPLTSYRSIGVSMDLPESDADVVATVQRSKLSPGYRTGILFRAGIAIRYNVNGRLVTAEGKTINLVLGEITGLDGTTYESTFTDGEGSFYIYGLTPGEYKILWPEEIGVSSFTITDNPEREVALGDIKAVKETP